jgi:predicted Fe-S protein YdhL (DUF1289 family)
MTDIRLPDIAERTGLSLRHWQREAAAGRVPSARYLQCGKRRIFVVDADRFADWWASSPEEKAAVLDQARERSTAEQAAAIRLKDAILATQVEGAETASSVYFMESAGFVKIGHSKNVSKRLSEIKLANPIPINLLGLLPGGEEREGRIHKALDDMGHKRRGEWFQLTDALKHAIRELCDGR